MTCIHSQPPRVGATICAIAALAVTMTAQQARDVPREPVGTAALAGVVVTADASKAPLRRARVTVTGGALVSPRVTVTDDLGRFAMSGLSAGQYAIAVDKDGYLKMNYGASRPSRQGTSVVLASGQRSEGLVVALPRGAVIAGAVTNSDGEPEPEVLVTALRWQRRGGNRTLVPVRQTTTDDRGEYRLSGLDAGEYLVSVEPSDHTRVAADLIRIPEGAVDRALRNLQQSAVGGSGVTPLAAEPPRPIGPAPVYFPGTARADGAATLTLAIGEERGGVNIRTQLVAMARVTGTVSADGQPVAGVQVSLVPLGPPTPDSSFAIGGRLGPKRSDANGQYAFPAVPPGEYRLQASTRLIGGRTGGPPPDPHPRMGFASLAVDGSDRTVDLTLQAGMSVSGRFAFEGAPAPATLAGARLTFESVRISPGSTVDVVSANAESDGTFSAEGLNPGRFIVTALPPAGLAGAGWTLQSITINDRDLLDAPFDLEPGQRLSDVVVTFTAHPAELYGTLQHASGLPTSDYFIVVFTADQRFWFPASRRIVSVRPDTTGTYRVRGLPPGEYFVAALTDVADGEWFDPDFLLALLATSPLRVPIAAGDTKRLDLRIGGK